MSNNLWLWFVVVLTSTAFAAFRIAEPISENEKSDLRYLREEEKLAHDVYVFAKRKYGTPVFSNVSESEVRHMSRVLMLLEKYEVPDPVGTNAAGVFEHPVLKKLYDSLIVLVDKSELAAYEVGATVEDLDIADIDKMMAQTTNSDLLAMYQNLQCGSRNHLRAFSRQLPNTYQPKFITAEAFKQIIHGGMERCGMGQFGNGGGRGSGRKGRVI